MVELSEVRSAVRRAVVSLAKATEACAERVCELRADGATLDACAPLLSASAAAASATAELWQVDMQIESHEEHRAMQERLNARLTGS